MINLKSFSIVLACLLTIACAQKEERPKTAEYEFIIEYTNGTKSGSTSRVCTDRDGDEELCATKLDFVQIGKYFCDMNNKLHIIINNERIVQEGFTCQSIVKDIFNNPDSSVKINE